MPEAIRIGMPMKAAFIRRQNAEVPETYLAFEPGRIGQSGRDVGTFAGN